ncbi:AMP-binding protein [Micromonospora sp. NPDC023956]|uniref:AMP-binding protein n=1 Tax=Micromonospora sp. NPDC023956 TaxID=3155722 RepID=UPI00340F4A7B
MLIGSAPVPPVAETGPGDVAALSRAATAGTGGHLVASGGTTGRIKVTTIAHHQGVPRLLRDWRPLRPGDVLLNLFRPGRLWGAHYFYNTLAAGCAASVLPMGPVAADDLPDWWDTFVDTGVTALAGAPSVLAEFAAAAAPLRPALPVRTVIWVGEPLTTARRDAIREAFPDAGLWGNYGSIETYVIAVNDPACDPAVLHLLPDQVLEVDGDGTLLSRHGEGWPAPAHRYRLGDRVTSAACPCGREDGLRVLGRADDRVKFFNTLLRLGDLLEAVREAPGVADAQLALTVDPRDGSSLAAVEIRHRGGEPQGLRAYVLRRVYALDAIASAQPDAVRFVRVDRLARNDRTGKVTPYLTLEQPR